MLRRSLSAMRRRDDDARALTRRFLTRSALAFVAIGVLVHVLVGRQVLDRYSSFAEFHAEFVARSLLQHELAETPVLRGTADPASVEALQRFVDEYVVVGDVRQLKVWHPDGTVVLSDDETLIGQRSPAVTSHLEEVLDGGTVTEIEHEGGGDDVGAIADTMESYVPIDVNGQPAVIEIYQDLGPTMAAARSFTRTFDAILVLGLAGLWGSLIPIVRRAARQLTGLLEREKETVQRLEELHDLKDTLLTAVSHELRTPLTVLKAGAQTLHRRGRELDPSQHDSIVGRIASNADRLEHLLSSLLDLDRLTRGTLEPDREQVDLRDLVERVVDAVAPRASVDVQVPTLWVEADRAHVERIIENLVTNALRHTPDLTSVRILARVSGDQAVLSVEDDGPGVPDEIKESIFQPFVQGELLRPESPGTGVGLALVARFAELSGGRAWVTDSPEGGAAFRVALPLGEPQDVPSRNEDPTRWTAPRDAAMPAESGRR